MICPTCGSDVASMVCVPVQVELLDLDPEWLKLLSEPVTKIEIDPAVYRMWPGDLWSDDGESTST